MHELRRHRRLQIPLQVEIRHPAMGTLQVPASDISDGGVFVIVDECFQLDTGESVIIRTLGLGPDGEDKGPPLVMKVVRKTSEGMGLSLEEAASANLESLAADRPPAPSVLQSLFIVNGQRKVLFIMQGDHWRLPSRELGSSESWQQGIKQLISGLKSTSALAQNTTIKINSNCYPNSDHTSPYVDLLIPATTGDDESSAIDQTEQTHGWFSSADIQNLNTVLDSNLVDNLLGQV